MTLALSSLTPPPVALLPRPTALRPISAGDAGARTGTGPQVDAEVLREEELQRLQHLDDAETENRSPESDAEADRDAAAGEDDDEAPHAAGQTPGLPGGVAAFLAQMFAQEEPEEEAIDPFGEATRAYQLREERHPGMVIDVRDPVDFEV